jgi:hypothetical protein
MFLSIFQSFIYFSIRDRLIHHNQPKETPKEIAIPLHPLSLFRLVLTNQEA